MNMDVKTINVHTPAVKPLGVIDYVDSEGNLVKNAPCNAVMVRDSDDLEALAEIYPPGTVAITAGGADKWQLSADKTWEVWVG